MKYNALQKEGDPRFDASVRPAPTVEEPGMGELEEMAEEGYCEATDGCEVEMDGMCPHGHVSWLVYNGII